MFSKAENLHPKSWEDLYTEGFCKTFNFLGSRVTIETSPQALVRDFIETAVLEGLPESGARKFTYRVLFAYNAATRNQLRKPDQFDPTRFMSFEYINKDRFVGFIDPPSQELTDQVSHVCYLDFEMMVKRIERPWKVLNSNDIRRKTEARETLTKCIGIYWRHERRHLLQELNGSMMSWRFDMPGQRSEDNLRFRIEREVALAFPFSAPFVAGLATGLGFNTDTVVKIGTCLVTLGAGLAMIAYNDEELTYQSYPWEQEAYGLIGEEPRPTNPIKVTFEDS